ncbi:MAG: hypothetical protein L6R41_005180 [Letrouitia leprolyta]|nr:MAG: hypothetical protein L6R41_005180 [Letrouitia leprolyta]
MQLLVVLAILGLAAAIPTPQLIDTAGVEAAPDPVIVTPAYDVFEEAGATNKPAIAPRNRLYRRDGNCAVQPAGSGPVSSPDTPDAFLSNPVYPATASSAPTPDGYSMIMQNGGASLSASNYMGLKTLKSYDTLGCASLCDQATGCQAFNMYIERDPSLDPNAVNCPNPPSITNYKCTLWGAIVSAEQAKNTGQWRDSFQVVIAASNAYNKITPPPAISCYTGPTALGGAINAPLNAQGQNTYMGYKYHPFSQTQAYDPSTCAADCNSQTAYNKRHPAADGSYQTCIFFNAYVLSMNGVPQGLYCSMYTQVWAAQYATNYGQYRGTDRYTVSRSYSYSLDATSDGSGSCGTKVSSLSSSSTSTSATPLSTSFQPTVSQSTTASSAAAQGTASSTAVVQTSSITLDSSITSSTATTAETSTERSHVTTSEPTTSTTSISEPTATQESTAAGTTTAQPTTAEPPTSTTVILESTTTVESALTSESSTLESTTTQSTILPGTTLQSTYEAPTTSMSATTTSSSSTSETTTSLTSDSGTTSTSTTSFTPNTSTTSSSTITTSTSTTSQRTSSTTTTSSSITSASTTPYSTTTTSSGTTSTSTTSLSISSTITTSSSTTSTSTSSSTTTSPSSTSPATFCLQNPTTGQFASLGKGGNGLQFSPTTPKDLPSLFTLDSATNTLTSVKTGIIAALNLPTFGKDGLTEGHVEGTTIEMTTKNQNYKPLVCSIQAQNLFCTNPPASYISSSPTGHLLGTTTKGKDGVDQFVFGPTKVAGAVLVKVLPGSACGPNYS